jgi:hypothetical protein
VAAKVGQWLRLTMTRMKTQICRALRAGPFWSPATRESAKQPALDTGFNNDNESDMRNLAFLLCWQPDSSNAINGQC